jgi:hypothetical protein
MDEDRDILIIAIFTFLTVSIWIFFELTKTSKSQAVTDQYTDVLKPLDPTLDSNIIKTLENRMIYK